MSVKLLFVLCAQFILSFRCDAVIYIDDAINSTEKPVILIGGLFPVHKNEDNFCGEILDLGVQRLEAMVLASHIINKMPTLLPEVVISFEIRDTCVQANLALEESIGFVRNRGVDNVTVGISGVVGAASSGVSTVVANLLRLFSLPQISYASTAKILSDKTRYDYFFRTVPPDSLQARAMAAIIEKFGWTYVHAIHSDDAYGSEGIEAFFDELAEHNTSKICIASIIEIPHGVTSEAVFDSAVAKLDRDWVGNSSVVVLFGQLSTATGVLSAVSKKNIAEPGFAARFTWIGSDAWGDQLPPEYHSLANGMLSVSPKAFMSNEFDEYFMSLNPLTHSENPWFIEYWEGFFNCTFDENNGHSQLCSPERQAISPQSGYRQNSKVTFTMDAVFAFAHAIHNIIAIHCPDNQLCPKVTDTRSGGVAIQGELLLEHLKNISFPGYSARKIQFDSSGDEQGDFVIKNLKKRPDINRFFYHTVGEWSPITLLNLSGDDIAWNGNSQNVPTSICSLPCDGGQFPDPITDQSDCCWQCKPCISDVLVSNGTGCYKCSHGFMPNERKTDCTVIVPDFLKWHSPWSVVAVLLSLCGLASTAAMAILVTSCRNHPLIKASSRELSDLMLVGFSLCYTVPFLFIAQPSLPICILRRFTVGISFCISYSALLVKVNRIFRIFSRSENNVQPPALISPRSQLFFTFLLVSVQVVIILVWIGIDRPSVRVDFINFDAELKCGASPFAGFVVSFAYNFILLMVSFFYGVKSRKTPSAFNETKLIIITLLCTGGVWFGIAPAYFGTGTVGSIYQTIVLMLGVILSASIMFGILFMPKVYYLITEKRREIREHNDLIRAQEIENNRNNSIGSTNALTETSVKKKRSRSFSIDILTSRDMRKLPGTLKTTLSPMNLSPMTSRSHNQLFTTMSLNPPRSLNLLVPRIEVDASSIGSGSSFGQLASPARVLKSLADVSTQTTTNEDVVSFSAQTAREELQSLMDISTQTAYAEFADLSTQTAVDMVLAVLPIRRSPHPSPAKISSV